MIESDREADLYVSRQSKFTLAKTEPVLFVFCALVFLTCLFADNAKLRRRKK
jgi:hypothetical protein